MMKKIFLILFVLVAFTSCKYYTYYQPTGSNIYTTTIPSDIKIYSGDIEQEYAVIASVAVDVMGDGDNAVRYLREKASLLGADAIIDVKLTKVATNVERTGISGVAVKFK